MGQVVQFNKHKPVDQADTSIRDDHHALLSECENLKSDLIEMLEGFQEMKEMIREHNKRSGWNLQG